MGLNVTIKKEINFTINEKGMTVSTLVTLLELENTYNFFDNLNYSIECGISQNAEYEFSGEQLYNAVDNLDINDKEKDYLYDLFKDEIINSDEEYYRIVASW